MVLHDSTNLDQRPADHLRLDSFEPFQLFEPEGTGVSLRESERPLDSFQFMLFLEERELVFERRQVRGLGVPEVGGGKPPFLT